MKAYPSYKDSGIEWLGEVPAHWRIIQLKYFSDVTLGKMLTPEDKGGYFKKPYLRAANLLWEKVDVSDVKDMWFSEKELKQYRLEYNDLLVSEGGEVGRTAIWDNKLEECYIQNSVNRVKVYNGYIPRYFLYAFVLFGKLGHFDAVVNRVSIAHLTKEKLQAIFFLVPPLPEQRTIADYLDHKTSQIDSLIEKKRRQIDLLKEQRTALVNQAVTKGLNPDVPLKDSGIEWLGEVPAHWEVIKIKRLSKVNRGASPRPIDDPKYFDENGEYAWVRIADVTASEKYLETTTQALSALGSSLSVKQNPGDFFVSIAGTVGKPIITKIKCCIHDGFVWFPNLNVNREFFYYIFLGGQLFKGLGKWGTQLNLNTETIGDIYIPFPPAKEIDSIADYLDRKTSQIDSLIEKQQQQIKLLQEYRTTLISEAVTGKIDVRTEN